MLVALGEGGKQILFSFLISTGYLRIGRIYLKGYLCLAIELL